jgi:hypothetical protein
MQRPYPLCVCLLLLFLACSKSADEALVKEGTPILGEWKLTRYLISPGSIGEWMNADPNSPSYVTFRHNGSVDFFSQNEHHVNSYEILSDSTLLMMRTTDSLQFRYTVDSDSLELQPPCIEPCSYKYVRVVKASD